MGKIWMLPMESWRKALRCRLFSLVSPSHFISELLSLVFRVFFPHPYHSHVSAIVLETLSSVSNFLSCHEQHSGKKKKSPQQHGSGQSEDGDTLFNDDSVLCAVSSTHDFFFFRILFRGSNCLLAWWWSGRKSAHLLRLWPDMFSSFFSPQLEAIVSHSCDVSLSSAEIYLSEDNWPLNPHLTTVKMPPQE